MKIRREDLTAAAAVGLLNYRQVEPLLVFLLQRDVRARREAMLAQMYPAPFRRLNRWLSWLLGALALLTALLFTELLATRAALASAGGALFMFVVPYGLGLFAVATWFRRSGLWVRVRIPAALIVASAPLAVLALHHVTG